MTLPSIVDLFRHMEWADAAVWTAILDSDGSADDGKLRGFLHHIHMVQRAFLRTWRGEPRDTPYPEFDALPPMLVWARGYYPEAFAFLDTLDDARLNEPHPLPWADLVARRLGRAPDVSSLAETATQVVMHSTYHRGQVNARLRELGGEPPLVDFIAWVWTGRPPAAWPEV